MGPRVLGLEVMRVIGPDERRADRGEPVPRRAPLPHVPRSELPGLSWWVRLRAQQRWLLTYAFLPCLPDPAHLAVLTPTRAQTVAIIDEP